MDPLYIKPRTSAEQESESDSGLTWTTLSGTETYEYAIIYAQYRRKWWQFWKPKTWTKPLFSGPVTRVDD